MSQSVAGHGNRAAVGFDYGPGDGQSQAGTGYAADAGPVGAVEAIEEVGKVCGVNADSVVGD